MSCSVLEMILSSLPEDDAFVCIKSENDDKFMQ